MCFPSRLSQAVRNLVENAIKYTGPGGAVQVSLEKDAHYAYIAVSDTGEGIAEEDLDRIFERFYRVDKIRQGQEKPAALAWGFIWCAVSQ